jgi:predicted RNase H-like HicB family nuclease
LDENIYWSVTAIVGPRNVAVSDGQTLKKARRRIRQALSLLTEIPEEATDVKDDVALPARVRRAVDSYTHAQQVAREQIRLVEVARQNAAAALDEHGLSRSDSGALLGLTKQRIQQLVRPKRTG